ncbi:MAG: hypothetical protein FWF43_08860 [Propionibacteriaceae bacterium]|nr:hypothetical protein [Propionibacteriaceae bacterium]
MSSINWMALLQVTVVTIFTAVVIAALMSLSNWFFTPVGAAEEVATSRKVIGFALLAVMGLIILFGLYLMIPYFH